MADVAYDMTALRLWNILIIVLKDAQNCVTESEALLACERLETRRP